MTNKYLIKFAWRCEHETLGTIISFVAAPYHETSPYSYGYTLSDETDVVFRFPAISVRANNIISKLAIISQNQWQLDSLDNMVEEEFDTDNFYNESYYQDNYLREVVFYTSLYDETRWRN